MTEQSSAQREARPSVPGSRSHPSSAGSLRPPRTPSLREGTARSLGATSARSDGPQLVTPSSSAATSRATSARTAPQRPATARQARRSSAAGGELLAQSFGALAHCFAEPSPAALLHGDAQRRPRALSDRLRTLQRPLTAPPRASLPPLVEAASAEGSSRDGSEALPSLYTMLPPSPIQTPRADDSACGAAAGDSARASPRIGARLHTHADDDAVSETQRFGLSGVTPAQGKHVMWGGSAHNVPVDADFEAASGRLLQVRRRGASVSGNSRPDAV